MNFTIDIHDGNWMPVHTIEKGKILVKGRHGEYHNIMKSTNGISENCGCYSWCCADRVEYCGSFAHDSSNERFESNLSQRIHNYLQNHRIRLSTMHKNTNLMVFERINASLSLASVQLRLFRFSFLQLGLDRIEYSNYSNDPTLVHAVEQLLICTYKKRNECSWNR